MSAMTMHRAVAVVVAGLALVSASCGPRAHTSGPRADASAAEPTEERTGELVGAKVVFLVRHGETVPAEESDDPRNPHLSDRGRARAERLSHELKDAGVTRVLSTDLHRTRETATPLAQHFDLPIEIYDPSDLASVAQNILSHPGVTLVSGHSNTTPELVGHLGGDPGTEIDHRWEYDRLYLVNAADDPIQTILLRYGEPSQPPASED